MKTIYSVRYDLDVYESNLLFSKVLFLSNNFDEAKKFYDEKVKELKKRFTGDILLSVNHINDYHKESAHIYDDTGDCAHEFTLTNRMYYQDETLCDLDGFKWHIPEWTMRTLYGVEV